MDQWPDEFAALVDRMADEAEEFFNVFLNQVDEFAAELDRGIAVAVEPLVMACLDLEMVVYDALQPMHQTWQPVVAQHPTCIGCRNYHGQQYGEELLVCAIHPYGSDRDPCPDWHSTWDEDTLPH